MSFLVGKYVSVSQARLYGGGGLAMAVEFDQPKLKVIEEYPDHFIVQEEGTEKTRRYSLEELGIMKIEVKSEGWVRSEEADRNYWKTRAVR